MEDHLDSQQFHLTDEQFTELLLGTLAPSVREHLGVCRRCSDEAERVSGAIGSFATESRLWAERRAAAYPPQGQDRQPVLRWLHRPQVWTAAAAGLAIALAVGLGISSRVDHAHPVQQQIAAKAQPVIAVSPTTLKADNELLTAIDGELRADESTSAGLYGLNSGTHEVRSRSSKRTSNE